MTKSLSEFGAIKPARICVAGAGAIGGTLAARLALAGHDVSVLARGATLAAIRASGLRLVDATVAEDKVLRAEVRAAERAEFGVQDIVFVSVKAQGLGDVLPQLAPLIGDHTVVVPTINGLPWWYKAAGSTARRCARSIRRARCCGRCRGNALSAAWCTSPPMCSSPEQ